MTHCFVKEELISCKVISAQQAPEDTDGCLKKIHIHIFVEGKLFLHPVPCFCKLCVERRGVNWSHKLQKQ